GDFNVHLYSKKIASWAQDDWQVTSNLTLNLGLRHDLELGAFANDVSFPPFQAAGRPADKTNFQPRLGFAYKVNDDTVVRGGTGLYYGDALGADQSFATGNPQIAVISYANDGRPDFATRGNRPFPDWGVVSMNSHLAHSAYHALQTGFTRRFSNRWQANATYTLSGLWSADTKPFSGLQQVTFATAPDLGGEWGLS